MLGGQGVAEQDEGRAGPQDGRADLGCRGGQIGRPALERAGPCDGGDPDQHDRQRQSVASPLGQVGVAGHQPRDGQLSDHDGEQQESCGRRGRIDEHVVTGPTTCSAVSAHAQPDTDEQRLRVSEGSPADQHECQHDGCRQQVDRTAPGQDAAVARGPGQLNG